MGYALLNSRHHPALSHFLGTAATSPLAFACSVVPPRFDWIVPRLTTSSLLVRETASLPHEAKRSHKLVALNPTGHPVRSPSRDPSYRHLTRAPTQTAHHIRAAPPPPGGCGPCCPCPARRRTCRSTRSRRRWSPPVAFTPWYLTYMCTQMLSCVAGCIAAMPFREGGAGVQAPTRRKTPLSRRLLRTHRSCITSIPV